MHFYFIFFFCTCFAVSLLWIFLWKYWIACNGKRSRYQHRSYTSITYVYVYGLNTYRILLAMVSCTDWPQKLRKYCARWQAGWDDKATCITARRCTSQTTLAVSQNLRHFIAPFWCRLTPFCCKCTCARHLVQVLKHPKKMWGPGGSPGKGSIRGKWRCITSTYWSGRQKWEKHVTTYSIQG